MSAGSTRPPDIARSASCRSRQRLLELLLGNLVVPDFRERLSRAAVPEVGIHAEECERQQDDRENDLDHALVFLD